LTDSNTGNPNRAAFLRQVKKDYENIEELLKFDEVDSVIIGSLDISRSLGVHAQTNHPLEIDVSKKVIVTCDRYRKSRGTQVTDFNIERVEALFNFGYTRTILGSNLLSFGSGRRTQRALLENKDRFFFLFIKLVLKSNNSGNFTRYG